MPLHRERGPSRDARPVEDERERAHEVEVEAPPPAPPPEAPPFGPTGEALARWLATPWAVWAALVLAAALRVAHLAFITRSPLADNPILDHQAYDAWAQRIAAGEWVGRGVFWVDPLYSYVLAVIYKVTGHKLLVVRGLQVCLGVVNAWLAGALTRKVTGSAALGAVGTFVAALCVPLIHNEVQLEKATLTATLACGALYLLLANTRRAAAWAGALAGLGALARGNLTLAIPFGALALLLAPGPDGDEEPPVKVWDMTFARESARRAARFLLAGLAVVGVLTLRNVVVAGELVPTTANGGQNLYIGQQRSNTYGTYSAPSFVRPDPAHEQDDFRAEAERRAGHPLSTMAVSSFWARAALDEVAADPGLALARTLKKLRLAFHQFEVPDNDDVGLSARFSPVLRLPLFWVGQLAPFALLGAFVWWRRSREARVVALAVALYTATLVAFFVVGRFRVPMLPALVALAVAGAAWLVDRARARDIQRALPAAAGLALGLTICLEPSAEMETLRTQSLAVAYNNLGAQLREGDDVRGAIDAYERAIAIAPASVVGAMRTLGDLYLEQRRYADAERVMRLVMVHKPGSPLGRAALVRLYEAMRRDPRYASDASVRARLAEAYREAGRFDEARALDGGAQPEDGAAAARRLLAEARGHRAAGRWSEAITAMKEAVRVGPYDEGARYALGELMEQRGDPADMVRYWAAQQASDPKPQTSLYFQAVGLARQGDVTAALAKLDEVLRVDPAHEMSELRYCALLEDRGDHAAALTHCDRAVEIFPDFRGAHEQRARVLTAMGRAAEAARATEAARSSDPNTIRRFRYWGRYLVRHQRYAQAIPELERALAADPGDSEAAALMREARAHVGDASVAPSPTPTPAPSPTPAPTPTPLPSAAGARTLSDSARAAIASTLAEGRGSPVWITASGVDPGAVARAEELAAIFTQAGWSVRALTRSPVRARAGVFMFAADEVPQAYVDLARRALVAGGMTPTVGTGYRAFYEQRLRENPGYQGFALAPDQTYVVVVGRVE